MVIGLQPGPRGSTQPGPPPVLSVIALMPWHSWSTVIALKPGLLRRRVMAPKPGPH